LVIINIIGNEPLRVIKIYGSFSTKNNQNPREEFIYQTDLMRNAYKDKAIIIGDLNLDLNRSHETDYAFKNYFTEFNESFSDVVFLADSHLSNLVKDDKECL
jgi:hypothetical protein